MTVVQINDYFQFSTGNIMRSIAQNGLVAGWDIACFAPNLSPKPMEAPGFYPIGTLRTRERHRHLAEWTGLNGAFSIWATLKMLRRFRQMDVQLVHLHNLQGFCVNIPLLFWYIKRHQLPVVWTLHGTWPYTGKCVHHVLANCDRWKTGCYDCPQQKIWPASNVDNSRWMWRWKKKLFTSVETMRVVAPSQWLVDLAKQSFLGAFPISVIHNGINQHVFRPTESNFRQQHGLENKIVLLGVAEAWSKKKGLDVMEELAQRLDEPYRIVLVETLDKERAKLPGNIVSIAHTSSKSELAQIYTAADLFIQPTRADTFPTVNMEALACGTPVITFRTGGSPEIIDNNCGATVEMDDIEGMMAAIQDESRHHRFTRENCQQRARQFTVEHMVAQYLELYAETLNGKKANEETGSSLIFGNKE